MDTRQTPFPLPDGPESRTALDRHLKHLDALSDEHLLAQYNELPTGEWTDASTDRLALLAALHQTFLNRFRQSPFSWDAQNAIRLIGPVSLDEEGSLRVPLIDPERQRLDQQRLSGFLRALNEGNSFEELDEETRRWWINRY
jgi:hypothetical protein